MANALKPELIRFHNERSLDNVPVASEPGYYLIQSVPFPGITLAFRPKTLIFMDILQRSELLADMFSMS